MIVHFMRIDKLILNADHIIEASFCPSTPQEGENRALEATLVIVTSEQEGVGNEDKALASANRKHFFRGALAERWWDTLLHFAANF